jgi:hypothetical protein
MTILNLAFVRPLSMLGLVIANALLVGIPRYVYCFPFGVGAIRCADPACLFVALTT